MSPTPSAAPSLEHLSELLPAYDFVLLIAHDDTGAVYKARQRSLDRDVAIKILPKELGSDPQFRKSFESKAKAMARQSHTNLIKVYDYGDADGLLYSVMEYVHGKSLFNSARGIKVDTRQALEIVMATCRGLEHAHENGIVHHDIRPANILLNEKREPKIGNFGLAQSSHQQGRNSTSGSHGYTAPEVLNDPDQGDQRSDIFAIGILLKELLTGVPANTAAFEYTNLDDAHLVDAFTTATAADPAKRHPDVRSFCKVLEDWRPAKPASRLQVPAQRPTAKRTTAPRHRPSLATASVSSINWALWKNCAVISFLLIAIHFSWNALQKKQEILKEQAEVTQKADTSSAPTSIASTSQY